MLSRYPHIAVVKYKVEKINNTSIPDVFQYLINIKGRFEPNTNNAKLNYSAKFYCRNSVFKNIEVGGKKVLYLTNNNSVFITENNGNKIGVKGFGLNDLSDEDGNLLIPINGKNLEFEGKSYVVSQAFSYQTHCKIWLD